MSKNSGVKTSSGARPDLELDVAIIGAGVSGLYTGWRLLTGKFKPKGLPGAGARADSNDQASRERLRVIRPHRRQA